VASGMLLIQRGSFALAAVIAGDGMKIANREQGEDIFAITGSLLIIGIDQRSDAARVGHSEHL
jgi:hypothetical protein